MKTGRLFWGVLLCCSMPVQAQNNKAVPPSYQDLLDTFLGEITSVSDEKMPVGSVGMSCRYFENEQPPNELVYIEPAKSRHQANPAATRTFKKGMKTARQDYEIKPGEYAECVFPSGSRVRVKVGKTAPDLYTRCLYEDKFMSIWVNKRKIGSQLLFSSQCDYADPVLDTQFEIFGEGLQNVRQCTIAHASVPEKDGKTPKPVTACVNFPDVARFPVDTVEYPASGQKKTTAGTLVPLINQPEVCKAVQRELRADSNDYFSIPLFVAFSRQSAIKKHVTQTDAVTLPKILQKAFGEKSRSYLFDFNNDGKPDQVIEQSFTSRYMTGNVFFVSQGTSASAEIVGNEKTSFLFPCQADSKRWSLGDCPPISQKGDDSGIEMARKVDGKPLFFHGRYSTMTPFRFKQDNFVAMTSNATNAKGFLAIFKPMPNWTFQPVCLFQKTAENF